jgi:hypothetical protein
VYDGAKPLQIAHYSVVAVHYFHLKTALLNRTKAQFSVDTIAIEFDYESRKIIYARNKNAYLKIKNWDVCK